MKAYPIGSVYTSTVATSPADLFGGIWEALPEGRVLLAQGASYPAGQQGGEATHAITEGGDAEPYAYGRDGGKP